MSNLLLRTVLVDTEVILVQIYNILTLAIEDRDWNRNKICRDTDDVAVAYLLHFLHCSRRLTVPRAGGAWSGR